MIKIKVKEDKKPSFYDYIVKDIEELSSLRKLIYKPIIGEYKVCLTTDNLLDIKSVINNEVIYSNFDLTIELKDNVYKKVQLAMPNFFIIHEPSFYEYLKDGIKERGLLIGKKEISTIYSSIGKSYEEIDDVLDKLLYNIGSYITVTEKDIAKIIVIHKTVYPRTVLISYINLTRWRKSQLKRCLSDINNDIILAAMIKNIKKLHKEKSDYLRTGLGKSFIRELNTTNLNLLYYHLISNRNRELKDITIILELYERGLSTNDLF